MTFTINAGQTVVINEGCYASGSCTGTVVLSFSSIIGQPTQFPTRQPTLFPSRSPTLFPTYNYVSTWTMTSAPQGYWRSITSSSNGQYLVAVQYEGIYTSSNC